MLRRNPSRPCPWLCSETLAEVHKEILRKRQAGRLPGDQGHLLKDWWRRHESWPYPTVRALAPLPALRSPKRLENVF